MSGNLEPEMLPDGAILAPISRGDGTSSVVRLEPGEEEHAAWLGYMQRQGRAPTSADRTFGLFEDRPPAFWGALAGAVLSIAGGIGPWETVFNVASVRGTRGDGWYVVIGGAMAGLLVLRARLSSAIVTVLLGVLIAGVGVADLNSIADNGGRLVDPAWGIYAVIAGGVSLILAGAGLVASREDRR